MVKVTVVMNILNDCNKNSLAETFLSWIFSWAISHICANEEYWSKVGATNRPENIVIRYVSFVSRLFVCI
jgi:hypothetical protein